MTPPSFATVIAFPSPALFAVRLGEGCIAMAGESVICTQGFGERSRARRFGLFLFAVYTLTHKIRAFSCVSTDNAERCYRSCAGRSLRLTKKSWIIWRLKIAPLAKFSRAQDVATRFMLKTGDLGRDSLERFSHLQEKRRELRFEFRTSLFLFFPLKDFF